MASWRTLKTKEARRAEMNRRMMVRAEKMAARRKKADKVVPSILPAGSEQNDTVDGLIAQLKALSEAQKDLQERLHQKLEAYGLKFWADEKNEPGAMITVAKKFTSSIGDD